MVTNPTSPCRRFRYFAPLLVVGASVALLGCGPIRIAMQARPASRWGEVTSHPVAVALFIDPDLEKVECQTRTPVGTTRIDCQFQLGEALTQTVENAVRAAYPQQRRVDACRCSDTPILICARLAAPPSIEVRWVQYLWTVGGGSTANLALRIDTTDCGSGVTTPHVITGYGSEDRQEAMANYPGEEEFLPAIDAALSEISVGLDRLLAGLTPEPNTQLPESKERSVR